MMIDLHEDAEGRGAMATGHAPDGDGAVRRRTGDDGHAGIECPNCGGRLDSHAGRIDDGRVFVCGKGRPLMREARYRCGRCGSTVIFIGKCEPEGACDDR